MKFGLIVVTGASGAGKTTICGYLVERIGFAQVITCTTRALRPKELDGVHYHSISHEQFKAEETSRKIIVPCTFNGHSYGTRRADLDKMLCEKRDVILSLELRGAREIRALYPEARVYYLAAPLEILRARALERGTHLEMVEDRHKEEPPLTKAEAYAERFVYIDTTKGKVPDVAEMILECAAK